MSQKSLSGWSGAGALLAVLALPGVPVLGAERVVQVAPGGALAFVDSVSGTSLTTIQVGDTVTWVWEGSMSHGVEAGTCSGDGGGGGYVGGVYGGGYGGGCTASGLWDSEVHAGPFSYPRTFTEVGSFDYYCDVHQGAMTGRVVVQPAATVPCVPDAQTMCLSNARYRVTAEYSAGTQSGHGTKEQLTGDSGYFWFFSASNIEVVVKVLDACAGNTNSHWVFAAGLTNVGVDITVTDTQTGAVYAVHNPEGTKFQTVTDTHAFPSSCP